jgi:hypothetical protein
MREKALADKHSFDPWSLPPLLRDIQTFPEDFLAIAESTPTRVGTGST